MGAGTCGIWGGGQGGSAPPKLGSTVKSRVEEICPKWSFWKHRAPKMRLVEAQCAHRKHCSMTSMIGRPGCRTMQTNGGSCVSLGIGNGGGKHGRGNQHPYRRYGPETEIQCRRGANTEFQYRPHIVDTAIFCGRHFRDFYCRTSLALLASLCFVFFV